MITRAQITELAYSAIALAIMAYAVRDELRVYLARKRAAVIAAKIETAEREQRAERGRGYLAAIREQIVSEEHDVIGLES